MKRFSMLFLGLALVISLAMVSSSCKSSSSDSTPAPAPNAPPPAPTVASTPTTLTTSTQGAQAASAGANVAQHMSTSGVGLSNTVGLGAPTLHIPFTSSAAKTKAVARVTTRLKPLLAKARSLRSSIMSTGTTTTITGTTACDNTGGTETFTMTVDLANPSAGGNISMTDSNCLSGDQLTNGTLSFVFSTSATTGVETGTITMGSAAAPVTQSTCATVPACTSFKDVSTSAISMTFTSTPMTATTGTKDAMLTSGFMQFTDNTVTPVTTDREDMANFSITDESKTKLLSAITSTSGTKAGSATSFEADILTIDGSVSTTHSETGNDFGEADSFKNFAVEFDTNSVDTDYYSINGAFAIALNPADKCIDGTFSFTTKTPISVYNAVTPPDTVAGDIVVNGTTEVIYSSTGVTVSMNGGAPVAYTDAQLNSLCAL